MLCTCTLGTLLFLLSPFSSSYSFILSVSSHPFIVILLLLGTIQALIIFFIFPMNELNTVSLIQASWLFPTGDLENLRGILIVSLRVIEYSRIILFETKQPKLVLLTKAWFLVLY